VCARLAPADSRYESFDSDEQNRERDAERERADD
jgi:hypothetical protein